MIIEHEIKREGKKLSGPITNVIFAEGEERGDSKECYSKDRKFYMESCNSPELLDGHIYVLGSDEAQDTRTVEYTYNTEEEAIQALAYINEFTKQEDEYVRGEVVEVTDGGGDDWKKRIYLSTIEGTKLPYIVVSLYDEDEYNNGEKFSTISYKKIRKLSTITMTYNGQEVEVKKEVAKELGFKI